MDLHKYYRLAAEEAYAPPDLLRRYQKLLANPAGADPGFLSLWGHYLGQSAAATALATRIQDIGQKRIADMDASGIARQILSLTAPGVQVFDADTATGLAKTYND